MITEQAIEFLESIEGKVVYLVEAVDDKVESKLYYPVIFDEEYIEKVIEEILEGILELKTWQHRFMRDFEHYVLYFKVNI